MSDDHNKYVKFLQEEHDSLVKLRHELNKDYANLRISTINQRRDFFKHITILSGVILGLTPFFLEPINKLYFWIGFGLILLLIIFILLSSMARDGSK